VASYRSSFKEEPVRQDAALWTWVRNPDAFGDGAWSGLQSMVLSSHLSGLWREYKTSFFSRELKIIFAQVGALI
jgi:hypothetical protein